MGDYSFFRTVCDSLYGVPSLNLSYSLEFERKVFGLWRHVNSSLPASDIHSKGKAVILACIIAVLPENQLSEVLKERVIAWGMQSLVAYLKGHLEQRA